jgi:hypothetical protein
VYVAHANALGNEVLTKERLEALCDAARHFHAIPNTLDRSQPKIRDYRRPAPGPLGRTMSYNPIQRMQELFAETHG